MTTALATGNAKFNPDYMFSEAGVVDGQKLREELMNHYTNDKAATLERFWAEGQLDGDEYPALVALATGDPIEAYRLLDNLLTTLIEREIDAHLSEGTLPSDF